MPLPVALCEALHAAGVDVRQDAPLRKKTWWRVGGPADGYVEVGEVAALSAVLSLAHAHAVPVFALGNASNLLISDLGIRGVVVRLVGALARAEQTAPGEVTLGGGQKLAPLMTAAERQNWTGLELFAGIPGTVGGAVRMNAGTALGEVVDRLIDVAIVTADGEEQTLAAPALSMSYRFASLPLGCVITKARFSLTDGDPHKSRELVAEHLAYRARTQPVDVPTCGSTFRNPPGDHAGRLIEAAGLKGLRIGGAVVSDKHANFLVNTGEATANDLRQLIEAVRARVQRQFDVLLEPEVHLAGEWP